MKVFRRIPFYTSSFMYIVKTKIFGRDIPYMGGIAINDKCNLNCIYCTVSNRKIPDLTYDEVKNGLQQILNKGIRNLYIEGGEPFLWKEDTKRLDDIIALARKLGFKFITVYTNGTMPIKTSADTVFVSLDGTAEINDKIRGKSYDLIIKNIRTSNHKKIIINCTVSSMNKNHLEDFCVEMKKTDHIKGIFFYFFTATNNSDELRLSADEKLKCIQKILTLKREGYRILNSRAALKIVQNGCWKRPNSLSYLFAENRLYQCCRFIDNDSVCKDCGYLGFPEIYLLTRLNLNAVFTAFKYL